MSQSAISPEPVNPGSVGRLTIRGLEVTAKPDVDLMERVATLERALEGLVLELVEHGSLPAEAPDG